MPGVSPPRTTGEPGAKDFGKKEFPEIIALNPTSCKLVWKSTCDRGGVRGTYSLAMLLERSSRTLQFAVRLRVLAKFSGQLSLLLALLFVVPLLVAATTNDLPMAGRLLGVIGFLGGFGWPASRIHATSRLQRNEAMVIVVLVFLVPSVLMAYPIMSYGVEPLDAFFESLSGITTTGLTTLRTVEDKPASFLFLRAWLQWMGGLGVLVLALAFLSEPRGVTGRSLGLSRRERDDLVGGTRAHARRVVVVYGVLTGGGFLLLWATGLGAFEALAHVLSAVSTGGFSTHDASLAAMSRASQRSAALLVSFLGATSFVVFYAGTYRKVGAVVRNAQVLGLLLLSAASASLVFFLMDPREGVGALGHAAWIAISAQTTAGFSTLPVSELDPAAKLMLIGSMLIGGSLGSTAGGIKILRFLIVVRLVELALLRASVSPSTRTDIRLEGSRVLPAEIQSVAGVIACYVIAVVASWMCFLIQGHAPLDSLFDVVSAIGTVGLSSGIVGPDLAPSLKAVLCADMLMGRVETLALIVALLPGTWLGRKRRSS